MSQSHPAIRILSDLHLAHPGSRISDPQQIAPLLDGVGAVVFNGDTIEERMKRFSALGSQHLETLRTMCKERDLDVHLIRGNHAPYTPPLGSLDLCGGQVFVTHGDVIYPDVSPWSRSVASARAALEQIEKDYPPDYRDDLEQSLEVSRRVTMEMQVCRPSKRAGLAGKLKTVLSQAWPPTRPLTILKVWTGAARAAETLSRYRPEAKVFLVGHTHRTFIHRRAGRVFVNTGAFLPMSSAWAVDILDAQVQVREIRERAGEFVLGKVIGEVELAGAPGTTL